MPRARTRIRRTLLLCLALLLLAFLLELNRWLPGAWPGGGSGGFRTGGMMGLVDGPATAPLPAPTRLDPARVDPPSEPPTDWPPRLGVLVEIRGPEGNASTGWRLGVGSGGVEEALIAAEPRVRDRDALALGLRVRHAGQLVRHRLGFGQPASRWVIHLPEGSVPADRQPGAVRVRVRDPATGEPLAGVRVAWTAHGMSADADTDAEGVAEVLGEDDEPFTVRITQVGRVEAPAVWVRPRDPRPVDVALPVRHETTVQVRWHDGRPAILARARLVDPQGREVGTARVEGDHVTLALAADDVRGAQLLLEPTRADVEGLRLAVPVRDLDAILTLPQLRTVRIVARDVRGEPIQNAEVLVRLDTGEGGLGRALRPWRTRTNLHGEAHASLAPDQACEIVVQRADVGPAARRLSAVDGSDHLEFVLTPGVFVPLALSGNQTGAEAFARSTVEGIEVSAHATPRGGGLDVGPLPAGPIEVFAHARGMAWTGAVVDARPAMGTVKLELERGWPLRLVVSDAYGVPLEHADVEVTVTEGEPATVQPARSEIRTDAQGQVAVQDLPDRIYEVRIQREGYTPARLRGLRPGAAVHFVTLLRAP
ncbi:MAG: hypothetical protein O2894_02410 [Planctomycetota bacterium]|nr:hypothetical protein [Planctomycetota bacterium]